MVAAARGPLTATAHQEHGDDAQPAVSQSRRRRRSDSHSGASALDRLPRPSWPPCLAMPTKLPSVPHEQALCFTSRPNPARQGGEGERAMKFTHTARRTRGW